MVQRIFSALQSKRAPEAPLDGVSVDAFAAGPVKAAGG